MQKLVQLSARPYKVLKKKKLKKNCWRKEGARGEGGGESICIKSYENFLTCPLVFHM